MFEQLEIDGIAIAVQRKAIKHINLKVYPPDGRVCISAPLQIDRAILRGFAIEKLPWIKRKQAKFQTQRQPVQRAYVSGETHHYRGQSYRLEVCPTTAKPRLELHHDTLRLYSRPTATIADRETIMLDWYRQQLRAAIPAIVCQWEPVMGVEVSEWRIKRMKTRWGTCNIQARRIWLNLDLIKASPPCLEYVIVHEMTHLLERLHNDRFHRLLDRFLPDWRTQKQELNQVPRY
jgi:predicted metal-dependent hydrolase